MADLIFFRMAGSVSGFPQNLSMALLFFSGLNVRTGFKSAIALAERSDWD